MKATVEESLALSARLLKTTPIGYWGTITWSFGGQVHSSMGVRRPEELLLRLDWAKKGQDYQQTIGICTTMLPWGKQRYWFTCPDCRRRCRDLYIAPGTQYFACRLCYNLTYDSNQNENSHSDFHQLELVMNRMLRMRKKMPKKARKLIFGEA